MRPFTRKASRFEGERLIDAHLQDHKDALTQMFPVRISTPACRHPDESPASSPRNTLARRQLTTTCEMYRLETVLRRQGFASQRERAADSYASLRRDRSSDTWPWITRVLAGIVRRRGSVDLSTTASMSLKQCTDVPHPPISRRGRGRNEALSPYQNAIRTSPAWRSGTAAAAGVP